MKPGKFVILATVFTLLLSAGLYAQQGGNASGDYQRLLSWMSGSFTSLEQSRADSGYYDIRLLMVPIWPERSDAFWLYVEQAVADYMDQPYRQRIYRLTQLDDSTFKSAVFAFEKPLRLAGAWRKKMPLAKLTPDSLTERKGCAIILKRQGDTAFVGSTVGKKCASSLSGASFATSEVNITEDELYSWDRGFDSKDNQVWGAEKGGYIFKKIGTIEEAKIIANLKEDMVKFDRAYIPALAFSEKQELQKSIRAMKELLTDWEKLKSKYYDEEINDPDWKANLDAIGALIAAVDELVNTKHDLYAAHNMLEDLKLSFGHIRQRYSIDYYIDYLNEFHKTMAAIIDIAGGKKPEDLSPDDIEKIKALYPDAAAIWKTVAKKRFDDKFFGFDEDKLSLMSGYMALESFALDKLGQALENDDFQQILQAAIGLKPNFAKLYKLFGNFSAFD
jgi:CpeT protein